MMQHPQLVSSTIARLHEALGEALVAVVLYGPEAHGDEYRAVADLHLLIVLGDLEPTTLARAAGPIRRWLDKGQPWPRLFTRELIRDSLDVFPIEFLDIVRHHRVLHGDDPLVGLEVDRENLRRQCERDLRERLMRLTEGYVERCGRPRAMRELLAASYASFAAVFRGCLHLAGAAVPTRDAEVVAALCDRLDLDPGPLVRVGRAALGEPVDDAEALFASYYHALATIVTRVDRTVLAQEEVKA
jgi:hypothetical protein